MPDHGSTCTACKSPRLAVETSQGGAIHVCPRCDRARCEECGAHGQAPLDQTCNECGELLSAWDPQTRERTD